MKLIIAVIQPTKLEAVKEALSKGRKLIYPTVTVGDPGEPNAVMTAKVTARFSENVSMQNENYGIVIDAGQINFALPPGFINCTPSVQHLITRLSGNSAGSFVELSNSLPSGKVPR